MTLNYSLLLSLFWTQLLLLTYPAISSDLSTFPYFLCFCSIYPCNSQYLVLTSFFYYSALSGNHPSKSAIIFLTASSNSSSEAVIFWPFQCLPGKFLLTIQYF